MQVKLILTYDILPGRDQDYFEFLVRELAPGLSKLGLEPTESWYTMYGKRPTILLGGIAEDYKTRAPSSIIRSGRHFTSV